MCSNPILWLPQLVVLIFITAHETGKTSRKPEGKCELVGTFSLITQALLGLLCLSLLIVKRYYEYPVRRTWKVWMFDVLKQLVGAFGVHVFNVILLTVKSKDGDDVAWGSGLFEDEPVDDDPCDWYFLLIVLDCTIGVYVLYLVFKWVNQFCKKKLRITQIDSGEYGNPPRYRAYFKQLAIYFFCLMVAKLVVFAIVLCFEDQLLWITHNIILIWFREYPDEFEIFMVMFVIPIVMNCLQLVLVDNFIQNQVAKYTNTMMLTRFFDDETSSQIDRDAMSIFNREETKRRRENYGATLDSD